MNTNDLIKNFFNPQKDDSILQNTYTPPSNGECGRIEQNGHNNRVDVNSPKLTAWERRQSAIHYQRYYCGIHSWRLSGGRLSDRED